MKHRQIQTYLKIVNVFVVVGLYSVYLVMVNQPFRPSFILDQIKIMMTVLVLILMVNVSVYFKITRHIKENKQRILMGFVLIVVIFIAGLLKLGQGYKKFNLEEHTIKLNDVELLSYTDKKLNENKIFGVKYYLFHSENERYLSKSPVLIRYYQEEFIDSYFDVPEYFVSEVKQSWFKKSPEDEKEGQIPNISDYGDNELNDESFKFLVESGAGKIGFKVMDRAMSAELIGVYQFDENQGEWRSIKTLEKTDEIHNVFMVDDSLFINYGSHHEGTMSLYKTDMSFERLERVDVPFVKPSDVYVHSITRVDGNLRMVAGAPKWDRGETETIYESKDNGETWIFIETNKI